MLGSPAPNTSASSPIAMNMYVEIENPKSEPFRAEQGEVYYNGVLNNFYIRKKRPDEEIQVKNLSSAAQKLFLSEKGSRAKEWNSVQTSGGQGEPAVVVHRGKAAHEILQKFPDRILPSRWHEKWKDMGDEFDNKLGDPTIPKHMGA